MTTTEALNRLDRQIAEIHAGRRGFISIPAFRKEIGIPVSLPFVRSFAEARGLKVERHGKYGWCIFRAA